MMIANWKRSKRSSPCRLESFSLTGWARLWFRMTSVRNAAFAPQAQLTFE
jgi:hypothetical protein